MPLPLEITVAETTALLADGGCFLLDCREPNEYEVASIPGAVLIPMGELPDRVGELPLDRSRRIVVHCHLGGRSLRVAQWLRDQGFASAQSMAGGIEAWATEIDPMTPRY
jgi:adenylyltransferase/sulfurtransferase